MGLPVLTVSYVVSVVCIFISLHLLLSEERITNLEMACYLLFVFNSCLILMLVFVCDVNHKYYLFNSFTILRNITSVYLVASINHDLPADTHLLANLTPNIFYSVTS